MKKQYFLILFLFQFAPTVFSQNNVTPLKINNQEIYITTSIEQYFLGTYLYDGVAEPIVQLNANGTGIFQSKDLSKSDISWGIASNKNGYPLFTKGFDNARYTLWYKNNKDAEENWTSVQLSIHFNKKKIFIAGERSKDYVAEVN